MLEAPQQANAQPRVTFSTLAKLMGPTTPVAAANLLRGHKYPSPGPKLSYRNARQQLIDFAVSQRPLNPLAVTRSHERDAIAAMMQFGVPVPSGFGCSTPSSRAPYLSFHGIEISVFPELDLNGPMGAGALKAYFGKDKLARGVGLTMAALVHYYKTQVLGQQNVNPQHCIVWEVRSGGQFASRKPTRLLNSAQAACQMIAALWPAL